MDLFVKLKNGECITFHGYVGDIWTVGNFLHIATADGMHGINTDYIVYYVEKTENIEITKEKQP